ncbi:MAG: hypothetical protein KatS3mg029_0723 [Saprospiraceae bacterium]|nr:MAG: hypothetical protein KatS3mg029_0723 [Saprospiraceae bacterium]
MKRFLLHIGILFFGFAFLQACSDAGSKQLVISGTISQAGNMQVSLERSGLVATAPNSLIARTETDASGNFKIVVENPLPEGLYRLRVGQQAVNLVFDGTERHVKVNSTLAQMGQYQYSVEGSPSSETFLRTVQGYIQSQPTINDIENLIETTENPFVGAYIATMALGNRPEYVNIHERAVQKLEEKYPSSPYVQDYKAYIASLKQLSMTQQTSSAGGVIPEDKRQPAPDIRLPGPDGKIYALSDLKGKVVLLDFWASWCMPCRRENPNVVKVYHQYKDKGFTVFSVSLDGVDQRTAARFNNDPKKIAELREQGKKAWIQAIQQDGLEWPYHVSDLKKWDCEPARQYGVTGIPRAFIIDKEGRIASTSVRGAEEIEAVIKQLL